MTHAGLASGSAPRRSRTRPDRPNPTVSPSLRWDIFCRVVDNFGDGGVCWRLARQLAAEHGLAVTLWIDDVATLARIEPALADVAPGADDVGYHVDREGFSHVLRLVNWGTEAIMPGVRRLQ
jgi:hypothetical protein